jgi:myo-inositol-1(or 4)-monophosphatase
MDVFLKRIVKQAGGRAWERFGKDGVYRSKSENPTDAVTKADIATERFIISEIRKKYPDHGFIAEESGAKDPDAEFVWVIDPIDGTLNFATGVPLFGTMVALTRKGEVVMGAIYIPVTRELFFAKKGGGAFCNGKRIKASTKDTLKTSRGCVSSTMSDRTLNFVEALYKIIRGEHTHVNAFGCLAVTSCMTAAGRRDWYVSSSPQFHDNAAPSVILAEAGYTVTDVKGGPVRYGSTGIVAAQPALHELLLSVTRKML